MGGKRDGVIFFFLSRLPESKESAYLGEKKDPQIEVKLCMPVKHIAL